MRDFGQQLITARSYIERVVSYPVIEDRWEQIDEVGWSVIGTR